MEEKKENIVYLFIILICIVGIIYVTFEIIKTPRQSEAFTELYLKFEKCDKDGSCFAKIELDEDRVFVDITNDEVFDSDEAFRKGDTLVFNGEFWNIVDISESQILFGKYPKQIEKGEANFTFVIINHLSRSHEYNYVIRYNESIMSEGKVSVENEQKKEVDISFMIHEIGEAKISVTLDTGEEVHFWLRVF